MQTPALAQLIEALKILPGVGQKTAQRMAFALLERQREGGLALAEALQTAMQHIRHCEQCRNFTEAPLCPICASPRRDGSRICIVESPSDLEVIEQAGVFDGHYFVLMGHLSPIDGIGPEELGLDRLAQRLQTGTVKEVILALSATVEGEATAWYLQQLAAEQGIPLTRLAQGVPFGAELEYLDTNTLAQAFRQRRKVEE
ncbi:MAG TPA: recombination protein RecR [Piscirickettsiaceae bacterium]|nr:recombination protein RecR [Piscirickettsiaceae bacterium]HIQ40174.1 recombination protein RecR [Sulfurivirga caldicuralii]